MPPRGPEEAPKRPPRNSPKKSRGLQDIPKKPPRGLKEAPIRSHNDWSVMIFPPLGERRRSASQ
eukprot:2286822-Pyramimonas_sp.AAC.1